MTVDFDLWPGGMMGVHLPLQGHSTLRGEDCDQMTPMDCMEVEAQLGRQCVQDTEELMDCCVPSQDREEEVQLGRVVGVLVAYYYFQHSSPLVVQQVVNYCVQTLPRSIQGVEVSPISVMTMIPTMEGEEQMALLW